MDGRILETILLLALPASGKSEVRRYLGFLSPEQRASEFHLGADLQLDDFPYVHLMRRIDGLLASHDRPRLFFKADDRPFIDSRDWGTLTNLLNEDYAAILASPQSMPRSPAALLFRRLDAAAMAVGIPPRLAVLEQAIRESTLSAIEGECQDLFEQEQRRRARGLQGRTLIIEFARGGPQGSTMPLRFPLGYQHSLSLLSDAILEKAVILYVWVTPQESRRKNHDRTDPNDPGSILHHGVPAEVMLEDYGCDDMAWLEQHARIPGTISVTARGKTFDLPIARLDNRIDKTSFLRQDPSAWKPAHIAEIHHALSEAFARLFSHITTRA